MKSTFSKLNITVLLIFSLALYSHILTAQKKYPSLLWEITGNGLSKPSYLYGTMHVSNKLVYHLADSFFVALSNVNTVGLESNPDQWLKNMKEMGLLEKLNFTGYAAGFDFYNDAFKIEIPDNKTYAEIIANDPDIINNLLYRNTVSKSEQEESTYIDLFIYKTGSKLDKKIVSLESFKTSLIMATKASTPDLEQTNYESKRNVDYFKIQNDITDSYRRGDLDALDSLSKLASRSKNFQKYLIEDRNVILAHNIDSISKTGSLFAGIGAAHLPGENGVIEMLRKMGYKLRPMANISTKKMLKEKDRIDEIVKKLPASKQFATDSLFSFDLFDAPVNLVNAKGFSFHLTTDMANGAYYTISRQVTYAPLFNYTADKMILKIDSLLYENVPGKIISKKDIVSTTGIKGLDITNKTKKGDLQRYQIYFMENELIMFKMAGKADYIKGPEATRFFSSIQFLPVKKTGSIVFSPPTKGFSATIPASYKYIPHKRSGIQGVAESLIASDKNTHVINGVIRYYYHDYSYLEEDSFELNLLCNAVLKDFGYSTNTKRTLGAIQNLPGISFSGDNMLLNTSMEAKIIIKGVHYYFAYTIYDTKNKPASDPFLNSFKLIDFNYVNEMKTINDADYNFKVTDEMVPEDRNQVEEALTDFYADIRKERRKKNHSTDFEYKSKSKTYYSPSSAEHINIDFEKFNDYEYRDPEKFWDGIKAYSNSTTLAVSKPVLKKDKNGYTYELELRDTACSNVIKRKYLLKDGLLLCLSAVCDSTTGLTGWTDTFFKTIVIKDSVISKPVFESKTAILLKNLSSADSSIKYSARQSLLNNFIEEKSTDIIIDYLKSPDFLKLDEDSRATILVQSGSTKNEKLIPIYKNLYTTYEDSSYLQICIIKGLGLLKTQNSYNTIYDLLKNSTPLTGDESNIQNVLDPLYDSLELCRNFFPGLFSLSTFEEYKVPVFKLFTDLVIRDIIPPAKYTANLPVLLSEASNEMKRYNASANKNVRDNYDAAEEAARLAEQMADYYSANITTTDSKTVKKTYPSYSTMIENYAVVLAPFYATNTNVKTYFDKIFKIKNEHTLLNLTLIATKNKIPVNDTLWKFFSRNPKTQIKLYNELKSLKLTDKFDKAFASQEVFCKNKIESEIQFNNYNYDEDNTSLIEKTKADSLSFLKKVAVKNNREQGSIYFFERYEFKTKTANLAFAFVADKNELNTQIEVLETNFVNEIGKTTEESIKLICDEFYYKNRMRYKLKYLQNNAMNYGDYSNYGDYEE